jgi:hypothetical protein
LFVQRREREVPGQDHRLRQSHERPEAFAEDAVDRAEDVVGFEVVAIEELNLNLAA